MQEFSNDSVKNYIKDALNTRKSDNLERCEMEFKGLDDKQMQIEHGSSGLSRQEILDDYRKGRRLHDTAIEAIRRAGLYWMWSFNNDITSQCAMRYRKIK